MNRVIPFLSVDGAKEAIQLYERAFDAKVVGDSTTYDAFFPDHPDKDKIAQVTLSIEQSPLFLCDAKDQPYKEQDRITISIEHATIEQVQTSFDVLQETAKEVFYPPTNLGWSDLGYSLRDEFGILWMVYVRT